MEFFKNHIFSNLTLHLFNTILESIIYNMIDLYLFLQQQFISTLQNSFTLLSLDSTVLVVDISVESCYNDNKEKIIVD